jgi:hypothetical protein
MIPNITNLHAIEVLPTKMAIILQSPQNDAGRHANLLRKVFDRSFAER